MNAKELRIDNIVNHFYGDSWSAMPIHSEEIRWIEKDNDNKEKRYKPIPITIKWLEKFGFENTQLNAWKIRGLCTMELIDKLYPVDELMELIKPVKYVHSLQNLYFALTNTELKIKQHAALNKSNK